MVYLPTFGSLGVHVSKYTSPIECLGYINQTIPEKSLETLPRVSMAAQPGKPVTSSCFCVLPVEGDPAIGDVAGREPPAQQAV